MAVNPVRPIQMGKWELKQYIGGSWNSVDAIYAYDDPTQFRIYFSNQNVDIDDVTEVKIENDPNHVLMLTPLDAVIDTDGIYFEVIIGALSENVMPKINIKYAGSVGTIFGGNYISYFSFTIYGQDIEHSQLIVTYPSLNIPYDQTAFTFHVICIACNESTLACNVTGDESREIERRKLPNEEQGGTAYDIKIGFPANTDETAHRNISVKFLVRGLDNVVRRVPTNPASYVLITQAAKPDTNIIFDIYEDGVDCGSDGGDDFYIEMYVYNATSSLTATCTEDWVIPYIEDTEDTTRYLWLNVASNDNEYREAQVLITAASSADPSVTLTRSITVRQMPGGIDNMDEVPTWMDLDFTYSSTTQNPYIKYKISYGTELKRDEYGNIVKDEAGNPIIQDHDIFFGTSYLINGSTTIRPSDIIRNYVVNEFNPDSGEWNAYYYKKIPHYNMDTAKLKISDGGDYFVYREWIPRIDWSYIDTDRMKVQLNEYVLDYVDSRQLVPFSYIWHGTMGSPNGMFIWRNGEVYQYHATMDYPHVETILMQPEPATEISYKAEGSTLIKKLYVRETCSKYCLLYENKFGGIDFMLFNEGSTKGMTVKNQEITHNYNSQISTDVGKEQFEKEISPTHTLKTPILSDEQSQRLYENLLPSKYIWMQEFGSDAFKRVIITDTTFTQLERRQMGKKKPLQYTIKVQESQYIKIV